jgi:hypothetical protein
LNEKNEKKSVNKESQIAHGRDMKFINLFFTASKKKITKTCKLIFDERKQENITFILMEFLYFFSPLSPEGLVQ